MKLASQNSSFRSFNLHAHPPNFSLHTVRISIYFRFVSHPYLLNEIIPSLVRDWILQCKENPRYGGYLFWGGVRLIQETFQRLVHLRDVWQSFRHTSCRWRGEEYPVDSKHFNEFIAPLLLQPKCSACMLTFFSMWPEHLFSVLLTTTVSTLYLRERQQHNHIILSCQRTW